MFDYIKENNKLVLAVTSIILLIVTRDILMVPISNIILTLVFVLDLVLLPYEAMVPFIFFSFSLTCGIPGYIMTFAYLALLSKGPSLIKNQVKPLLIVVVLELMNESFRDYWGLFTGMLSFFSFTALFFYFLGNEDIVKNKVNLQECMVYYAIGSVFTFFIIYYNMISFYGLSSLLGGYLRSGALGVEGNDKELMQGHIAMNANTISYLAICVFSIITNFWYLNKINKYLAIVLVFLSLIAGLFTFSRTFVLCVILYFSFLFFISKGKSKFRLFVSLSLVVIVALCVLGETILTMMETFNSRVEEDNVDTAGGRTVLFALYNEAWMSNLVYVFIGVGVVSYRAFLHLHNAMHSGLQQVWVCLGVVGVYVYASAVWRWLKGVPFFYLLPFIITFLFDQSVQFLNPYPFIFPIMVAVLYTSAKRDSKKGTMRRQFKQTSKK